MACDAEVLARTRCGRQRYARLLYQYVLPPQTSGVVGMSAAHHHFKSRLLAMKTHPEPRPAARAQRCIWRESVKQAEDAARRATNHAARATAAADEWKARSETLALKVRELRAALDEANLLTNTARGHLMATETKLDLIEAAIQVLDTRTREAALTRS